MRTAKNNSNQKGGAKGRHWKIKDTSKYKKPKSKNHRKNISKSKSGKNNPMYGLVQEMAPNWQGGKSFEAYGLEFNEDLKEVIRNRDRRKCFICEKTELENKEKLTVHHIDYDKKNNNPNNLISLCRKCHGLTNGNRNYWENFFYENSEFTKYSCFCKELRPISEEGEESSN